MLVRRGVVQIIAAVGGFPACGFVLWVPGKIPAVAGSLVWGMLLNPSFGTVNYVLNAVGLPALQWLQSPVWAKPGLVLLGLWTVGNAAVLYLAGLQGIPSILYAAARIDGAGPCARLGR